VFSPEYLLTYEQPFIAYSHERNLRDVQKAILVLVLVVDAAHKSCRGRKHLIDEDENSLLWRQLDALANHIHKLADGEICGHQVLLLVDRGDVRFLNLFANDLSKKQRLATEFVLGHRA